MQEKTKPQWIKTAVVTVISVAVLSAVFLGVNGLVFTATTGRGVQLPPFDAMSAAPVLTGAGSGADAAKQRTLHVQEMPFDGWPWGDSNTRGENTLGAEEAAQIGAQYIYDIFGVCVDGATVEMSFNGHIRHRNTLGVWAGTVKANDGAMLYFFMVNAETGEAIHVEGMEGHERFDVTDTWIEALWREYEIKTDSGGATVFRRGLVISVSPVQP